MNGDLLKNPIVLMLATAAGLYLVKLLNDDRRHPHVGALPGATSAPLRAVWIAVTGALIILIFEILGEKALGIADQQTEITWLFALYSVAGAPVIEELSFRGFLVIEKKGRAVMWTGVIAASLAFALLHPYLWSWEKTGFALTLTTKGWFTAGALFVSSLWLYAARLAPWNPAHSLFPCIAAHAAKNVGVVIAKAATGHMGGLW